MLLLAVHQHMKLQREKSQLTLKLTRLSTKKSRVSNLIKSRQKQIANKKAQWMKSLKAQANYAKSQINQQLVSLFGGGFNNSFNTGFNSTFGGNNSFVNGCSQKEYMRQLLTTEGVECSIDGVIEKRTLNESEMFEPMYEAMEKGELTKKTTDGVTTYGEYPEEQYFIFKAAFDQFGKFKMQSQQSAAQQSAAIDEYVNMLETVIDTEIEAKEEEILEPLNHEELMIDLEKEHIETRLEMIKAELESYDKLRQDGVKNAAPKFGLGG